MPSRPRKRPAVTTVRWALERSTQLASRPRSTARSVAHPNRSGRPSTTMGGRRFRNFQDRAVAIWRSVRVSAWDNQRESPGEQGFEFEMEAARAPAFLHTDPAARILIVEDDPDLAADLDALFRRYGFETEVVRNRTAALQRVASADLVVLDLALPDGDGLEICGPLSAQRALVIISGRVEESDR